MPTWWTPHREWEGTDVFVIGGGPSLRGFDWSLLHGRHTIGCNDAFRLGSDVCRVVFFSDAGFYERAKDDLARFPGLVVSHCPRLVVKPPPFVKLLPRMPSGLFEHCIGFGKNSGCGAVNLALLMGASRVFLLGFDCKVSPEGTTHWHDHNRTAKPNPQLYPRFLDGWRDVSRDLPRVFPGRQVINLGPDSAIPFFPQQPVESVLHHDYALV